MNPPTPFLWTVHRGTSAGLLALAPALLVILAAAPGAHAVPAPPPVAATITVSGNITDAQSGAPVQGATVSTNLGATTTTNRTGGYTIGAPAGSFTLTVYDQGYHGQSRALTLRNSYAGEDIVLWPYTFTVRGTVVDQATSLPIVGASVQGPFQLKAVTTTKGQFTFHLENGTFSITVSVPNYQTSSMTVTVNGTTQTPFFRMAANGSGGPFGPVSLSGPAPLLVAGVVAGGGTALAAYVVYARRRGPRFREAPLAGLPSQQTDEEAAQPRAHDRRSVRRRR